MDKREATPGQLMSAVWAAALAFGAGIVPRLAARQAGAAGWLAPAVALPGLLAAGWLIRCVTGGGRVSLARAYRLRVGRCPALAAHIIYIVWGVALAGAVLRTTAQRVFFAARTGGGPELLVWILAAMALWLVWGKTAVFARTAVLLWRGVLGCLVLVLVLTAGQIHPENILGIWLEDAGGVARAAAGTLGVLCTGLYGAFVLDEVSRETGMAAGWSGRAGLVCGVMTLLVATVLGSQGAPLTARLADPFITLAKHAGAEGALQRVESLVAAVWLLGDLVLLGLILCGVRGVVRELCPGVGGGTAVAVPALAAALAAGTVFAREGAAEGFCQQWLPAGGLVLFFALPALVLLWERGAYIVSKCREKRQI